VVWWTNCK